jgi:hypothetical protein
MQFIRFASSIVFTLVAVTACSDDESTPSTTTNPNQPAGSTAGSAGSAGTAGAAGSAGATSTSGGASGGTSSEGSDDDIGLDPSDQGNESAGSSAPDAGSDAAPPVASDAGSADTTMSFFVTSVGGPDGGNLGGLEGADALCTTLATAVSAELGAKTWRAYLSTTTVNARDRIGSGPWFNQAGVLVANNVAQLTDQGVGGTLDQTWARGDATIALDELGNQVPAGGAGGVQHDILTGTLEDGTVATGFTCNDWTATTGFVEIGHANRGGGGDDPTSWSSAHNDPSGCAPTTAPQGTPTVASGGGRGSVYCFAAD